MEIEIFGSVMLKIVLFETQKAQQNTKGFHKSFKTNSFVKSFCVLLCLLCFKQAFCISKKTIFKVPKNQLKNILLICGTGMSFPFYQYIKMLILTYFIITIVTVAGMEFVAWFAHKYIMHGFLWSWHEDHHQPHKKEGFFEKNDRFFLVFALPSMSCYIIGSVTPHFWVLFVGIGISIYGLIYFLIHDVYIHQRFKWFRQLDSPYSRAILRAHGAHHAKQTKEDGESFGLLVVGKKYFKSRKEWKQASK